VAPYIQGPVVIQHRGQIFTPILRGVDANLERTVSVIPAAIVEGAFDLSGDGAVIGRDMALRLGLQVGDKLLVNSPRAFMARDEIHLPEEFVIQGIFEVGMWEFDVGYVLCALDRARDLYGVESGAQALHVMARDPYRAHEVAARIRSALGGQATIETWMEQNRQLFSALRVEKNMMFFLLIFITIVAAFGITNTLITVAIQKTREIGLFKAMGYSSGTIMRIFFWQGWIEGILGTGAGILAGLYILHERNNLMHWLSDTFRLELFPKELYRLNEIPAQTSALDVFIVAASVVAMCTLAGLIPAYRAARLDPVQALRHE
jgi:lipoprotein-releasing system permease protein